MVGKVFFLALLVVLSTSLHIQGEEALQHEAVGEKRNLYLVVKNLYLTSCSFCPEKNFGTVRRPNIKKLNVFVGEQYPTETSKWESEDLGNGQFRFRNIGSDRYLAWCQDQCKMGSPISIISTKPDIPNTRWRVEQRSDGKYTLKATNGQYLGFCNGCLTGGFLAYKGVNYIALANKSDQNDEWAGFSFNYI